MLVFKKILCPTDFSEPSYHALQKAMAIAAQCDAALCLLHVLPRSASAPGEADWIAAERNLQELIRDYAPPHLRASAIVRAGDAADEILNAVCDEKIDLIVMATHGATGWREFALGSVMDAVVRLSPCPVFSISGIARQMPDADFATEPDAQEKTMSKIQTPDTMTPEYSGDADFPFDGSPEAQLRFLLSYAIRAPSSHNSQPWRWRICGDTAELYADRTRALPHLDPDHRELIISCGAALLHLRVAIQHFGHRAVVEVLSDSDDPDLLAIVRLGEEYSASPDDDLLFDGIPLRHTNRHPFLEREVPTALQVALENEAKREGTQLLFVGDTKSRMAIINLIARSDQLQGRDPQFLQEIAGWIRPSRSAASDGIPQHALGGSGPMSRYTTDAGAAMSDQDRLLAWSAPLLAVLETVDDTPRDWIAAGQGLARVLLRASAEGVQASFFNSPVEVVGMWPQLHRILRCAGLPQMILRLGYPAQKSSVTPRRTVSEVMEVTN